jgi:hypothetical protein
MLILTLAALAADIPPRPPPTAPIPNECSRAIPLVAGSTLSPNCGGVLLPSIDAADLLATEAWADHLEGACRVDLAAAAADLSAARDREAWYRAQARPGAAVWVGAGVIGGVGITLGAAWALGMVAE